MGSSNYAGSPTLMKLAEQLRLYKPPDSIDSFTTTTATNNTIEQQRIQGSAGGVVSPTYRVKPNTAAVLICLFEGKEGDLRVILTKRSSKLSTHSGEVSLPGGKVEEGDASYTETALREAKEEIGLDPSLVDVVTLLEPFTTKNGMMVIPVVGILGNKDAFIPVPNAAEVEAIFDTPLEMYLKDENRRETELEWMGSNYLLHFFDHQVGNQNFVIWALTAGILIKAASIVYQRPPAFQERRPQFWHRSRH